mmetsp:Transcript_33163/g.86703  ORF Transcript_33163/g.86703 Transcript_33163/m.86703 type:complete len:92 (+) Transcript_33163:526-801(+)
MFATSSIGGGGGDSASTSIGGGRSAIEKLDPNGEPQSPQNFAVDDISAEHTLHVVVIARIAASSADDAGRGGSSNGAFLGLSEVAEVFFLS